MNKGLLLKVKKHILQEPRRLVMGDWIVTPDRIGCDYFYGDGSGLRKRSFPPCKTVACIAGWSCLIADPESDEHGSSSAIRARATALLGISPTRAERLFYVSQWPKRIVDRWNKATTQRARAEIAAKRIDHFIATKGAE